MNEPGRCSGGPLGTWADACYLLAPDDEFLRHKFIDHRAFTILIMAACGPFAAGLWVWDWVRDPTGAQHTLMLHSLYFLSTLLAWVVWRFDHYRLLAGVVSLVLLFMPATHLAVISRLDGGMSYGLAGFIYFQIVAVVFLQCFSLRWNLLYAVAAAALPHLVAWFGWAPTFPDARYAVLVWPAVAFTWLIQTGSALSYLHRYHSERQLERAARTDPMTGAANRRYFMPRMAEEIRRARRFRQSLSLLMLDIDHFKRVNDQYGHPAGDDVIRTLARTCQQGARQVDLVARLGGEEFAILLPGADLEQAASVAERLRRDVSQTVAHGAGQVDIRFTVSIGVCQLTDADADDDHLMARSDAALYKAKHGGRNQVCAQ